MTAHTQFRENAALLGKSEVRGNIFSEYFDSGKKVKQIYIYNKNPLLNIYMHIKKGITLKHFD